jgi:large subunit ribosomal protein L15
MNLSNLKPAKGSTKNSKRIGRGTGSGRGGTSTRGHKGAGSRSGHSTKIGFEGGQMPLQRRVPKVGFKPINRVEYVGVNLDVLQGLAAKNDLVKILGRGEVKSKLEVKAHAFSATAQKAIEAVGGSIEKL